MESQASQGESEVAARSGWGLRSAVLILCSVVGFYCWDRSQPVSTLLLLVLAVIVCAFLNSVVAKMKAGPLAASLAFVSVFGLVQSWTQIGGVDNWMMALVMASLAALGRLSDADTAEAKPSRYAPYVLFALAVIVLVPIASTAAGAIAVFAVGAVFFVGSFFDWRGSPSGGTTESADQ